MLFPSYYERLLRWEARKSHWQRWFAWWPTRVDEGIVWLEWVMRKRALRFDRTEWAWRKDYDYRRLKLGREDKS